MLSDSLNKLVNLLKDIINSKQDKIVKTPINDTDAANKAYVDNSCGIDWEATPYTNMNYANSSSIFCCALLATERRNSTIRYVRGMVIVHVKSDGYSGIQQVLSSLPSDFPALTFETISNDIVSVTGTETISVQMTGTGTKVTFRINPGSTTLSSGFYIGCVNATLTG